MIRHEKESSSVLQKTQVESQLFWCEWDFLSKKVKINTFVHNAGLELKEIISIQFGSILWFWISISNFFWNKHDKYTLPEHWGYCLLAERCTIMHFFDLIAFFCALFGERRNSLGLIESLDFKT